MAGLRVAIVGAGIGGLTAALTLAARGHQVTVLERRTGFGETGAGIQLSPNASRVLFELGLGPSLSRAGCTPERVVMRAIGSGRELARVPLGAAMRERYGAPYLVTARADLHTSLLDAVRGRGDTRLLVGRTLVAAEDGADQAAVTFETAGGSRETITADLVIGADGVWSQTRQALGDRREPVYRGHAASRAVVPVEQLPDGLSAPDTGLWLGRGRHVVHYAIGAGKLVNIVVVERRAESRRGWSEPESRDALLARFGQAAPQLKALLAAPETWAAWSLFDLPVGRLVGRRVALIGDAAHPVLPYLAQGGALAIEDAAELALALDAAADVRAALGAYARARARRAAQVQGEARRNGRIYHLGGPAALARDLVLRRSRPEALAERYAWLYGWRPGARAS